MSKSEKVAQTDPRRTTKDQVRSLRGMGLKARAISKGLDISTQRVYQIFAELDKEAPADNGGSPRARDGSRAKSTA